MFMVEKEDSIYINEKAKMYTIKHVIVFLIAAVMTIFIAACTFEEPTLPSWNTEWRIPLANPGFVMKDIANDSTLIESVDENGIPIIAINIADSTEKQQISRGDLAILPEGDNSSQTLGDVSLDSPGTEEGQPTSVSDLLGVPLVPGTMIDIPAQTRDLPPAYVDFSSFEFVVNVKTGYMTVEFVNESFLDFTANTTIDIYDSISQAYIGTAIISDPVAAFSQAMSAPVDLAGKEFSNHLRFDLKLPIAAKTGYVVQEDDVNGMIFFRSSISEMKVGYAHAEIPEQNFSRQDSTSLEDEKDRMITATIDAGHFRLEIENTMNVAANVRIELLNFYLDEQYTEVFTDSFSLPALGKDVYDINLNNLYIVDYSTQPNPGSFIDYFKYRYSVRTVPSEGMVELAESDSVNLAIAFQDSVYLAEFYGDLDRREFDFDPQEQSDVIDAAGIEGSVRFEDIEMFINFYNQVGMELQVNLDVVGYKENKTDSIRLIINDNPIRVPAGTGNGEITEYTLVLNGGNSNLVEFIEFLPQDIRISGNAVIEGNGQVALADEVWTDYQIYSPFFLNLSDSANYTSEVDTSEIDDNISEAINNGDVQSAGIYLDLANGLPIGARMELYVSADPDNIFDRTITDSTQKFIIDDVQFESGTLNANNYVVKKYEDTYQIQLTRTQLELFTNPNVYIASKMILDDTDGLVKFRATDEISAIGAIRISYIMNNGTE